MTDHELILKIYDHVTIMNSEQGLQAVQIGQLVARMEAVEKIVWGVLMAVLVALVGIAIKSIADNKNKK